MQSTSETWKELAALDGTRVEAKAIINNVEYTNIEPPVITRGTMQNGVSVGNVVSAMCMLTLDTSNTIPKSAEIQIQARLVGGTEDEPVYSEWLPQGTFYLSRRTKSPDTNTISLECYDGLLKSNAIWEPSAGDWPRQASAVLVEIATIIGLQVDARTTIAAYTIGEPEAGVTMRDMLGIIAQQNFGNWIVTHDNKLRLVPVVDLADAESATETVEVDAVIGEYYADEVKTITGLRVNADSITTLIGDETGVVVDLTIPAAIATQLADSVIGITYKPFTFGTAFYDIAAELGDFVHFYDTTSVLYNETVTLGPSMHGDIAAPDTADIGDEYPYVGASEKNLYTAKSYAEAVANEAVGEYDETLTQQQIFNKLTDNGAAQGLVLLNGQLYVNASYINAGYLSADRIAANAIAVSKLSGTISGGLNESWVLDLTNGTFTIGNISASKITTDVMSADRIRGGTLVLGGLNNQNGTLQVLDASGNVVGTWDNNGVEINGGTIHIPYGDGHVWLGGDGLFYLHYLYEGLLYKLSILQDELRYSVGSVDQSRNDNIISISPNSIRLFRVSPDAEAPDIKLYDSSGDTQYTYIGVRTVEAQTLSARGALVVGDAATTRANLGITPANIGAVAKSGDTMTGNLTVKNPNADTNTQISVQTTKNSGAVTMRADQEGGNITILSKNGKTFEIDAYDDTVLRIYSYDDSSNYKSATFNRTTGALSATGGFSGNATNVTGTVAVNHGGTGATTAAAARNNLSASTTITFTTSDTTAALIYNKLNVLRNNETATVYIPGAVMALLTKVNGTSKMSGAAYGTVARYNGSPNFRFFVTRTDGQYAYGFGCNVTASALTTTAVYQFAGTAM